MSHFKKIILICVIKMFSPLVVVRHTDNISVSSATRGRSLSPGKDETQSRFLPVHGTTVVVTLHPN